MKFDQDLESEDAVHTAVVREEDGGYVAECPEVGTVSQGDTLYEALDNLKAATELYLDTAARNESDHTIPCDRGPLCPHCEIDRLRNRERLWQGAARAASMLKGEIEGLHEEEVDLECSDGFLALVSALTAARAAGLTWEEKTT